MKQFYRFGNAKSTSWSGLSYFPKPMTSISIFLIYNKHSSSYITKELTSTTPISLTTTPHTFLVSGFLKTPPNETLFSWWLVAMWLATGGWVASRWLVPSHHSLATSHQKFNHQVASHQDGSWLGASLCHWWLVTRGWWLVAHGWLLVARGWWLVADSLWLCFYI